MKPTKIQIILYLLWVIGLISFSIILYEAYCLYKNDKTYFELLAPSGILISAFIASFSVMRNIENTNNNELSKYYVEKCDEGFKIVYDLLKDQNNNPSTWIEAARILKYTIELSNKITDKSYKKVYNIKSFQYRHLLIKALTDENGNSLRTSFFFGIKDWKEKKVTEADEIALENSRSSGEVLKYEVPDSPKGAFINESAIKIIFDFISYEDYFYDPLKNEEIEDLEQWKYSGYIVNIKAGAYKYLKYKKDLREKS